MKLYTNKYFLFGLLVFYIIQSFAPNKIIYFFFYFIVTWFFYKTTRQIKTSLLYSLILSLFSEVGLAGSMFLLEPQEVYQTSGYWISPATLLITSLLILSITQKLKDWNRADSAALLFFVWLFAQFLIAPHPNSLFGLLRLIETFLMYYVLRLNLKKVHIPFISTLIISMIAYQCTIAFLQVIFQQTIGLPNIALQNVSTADLYQSIEDESLLRVTGAFSHPNFLATFIMSFASFLFLLPSSNALTLIKIMAVISLFFTFSRAAWILAALLLFIWVLYRQLKGINFGKTVLKRNMYIVIGLGVCCIIIAPLFFVRIESIPKAFENFGSFDVRMKTLHEAWTIIAAHPVTGVGLTRSLETYVNQPATDLFTHSIPTSFYKIHNTFLEMAAETGIFGTAIFVVFLMCAFIPSRFTRRIPVFQKAVVIGLIEFTFMAMLNPFFHAFVFRWFFIFAALLLL